MGWLIALIVIVSLLFIIDIVVAIIIGSIKRFLKRKGHALDVLIAQKFDLLVTLGNFMIEKGCELPQNIKDALNININKDIRSLNTSERLSIKSLLHSTVDTMFYIAEQNGLEANNKYITLKNSLREIDTQHRKDCAIYNTNVMAYNYWIKFLPFRPFAFFFRMKPKEYMY